MAELLQLAGSIASILFIAWLARFWRLGGDVRIHSEAQASVNWDRSIHPWPTGERAMRSSRRVSATAASEIGLNRLWMGNFVRS